jgi:hypothetical protein
VFSKFSPLCSRYDSSHLKNSLEVAAFIWFSLKWSYAVCILFFKSWRLTGGSLGFEPPKSFSRSEFLLAVRKLVNTLEGYNILEGAVPLQTIFQYAVTPKSESAIRRHRIHRGRDAVGDKHETPPKPEALHHCSCVDIRLPVVPAVVVVVRSGLGKPDLVQVAR